MLKRILLCFFIFSFALYLSGQEQSISNIRIQTIQIDSQKHQYTIDSLSISLIEARFMDKKVNKNVFTIEDNIISFSSKFTQTHHQKKIFISYRALPFLLSEKQHHLDTNLILAQTYNDYIGFQVNPYKESSEVIQFKELDYDGSFERGLSFGNSQNLVLNSNFNLQMAGEIGDEIEILAAITDNNIPLQPEGNTQQLQEFDKIFIQLSKNSNQLVAGDYELKRPNSYFMNYYKKLQGATFNNVHQPFKKATLTSKASVAIARGKFARNILNTQEGNQGPYRLQGSQGERFLVVLAGTEKVYFDGELLTRGIEGDYIIDYNRADISFTNKRLITKDSRIIIEFEYADQQYLRSLYAFDTQLDYKKWQVNFYIYSEQDSRNSGNINDLDSLQRDILSSIGDNVNTAFSSSIQQIDEFNEFRIQYKQIDTFAIINDTIRNYQVLVYDTNPDSALYTANFTNVGNNMGNYILSSNNTQNGRVYQWVAPNLDGTSNGNFEPISRLAAPSQKQLYTLGGKYQINKNAFLATEIALSKHDLYRFTSIGDNDDLGIGWYSEYKHNIPLKKDWNIKTALNYEYIQSRFRSLNPYRKAEFTRNWNLANNNNRTNEDYTYEGEHIAKAKITLTKKKWGNLSYEYSTFSRGKIYNGQRHISNTSIRKNGFQLKSNFNWLAVKGEKEDSRFLRPQIDFSKTIKKLANIKMGINWKQEKNQRYTEKSDTLNIASFYYNTFRAYLEMPTDKPFFIMANVSQRHDYAPNGKSFKQNTLADEFNINGRWEVNRSSQLNWDFTYRNLKILDESLSNLDPQHSSVGRLDYQLRILKNSIRSTTSYELGAGQEARINYNYLPVNQGDGVYYWDEILDINGDGVPQVNEIRTEAYQGEGNIIRVTIYTDEFIRTNNVTFNESLNTDFNRLIKSKKGIKKWLKKIATQSTVRISRRTRASENVSPFNPFQLNIADTSLIALNANVRNVLYINRGGQKYDVQIGQTINQNRIVLTSGYQARKNTEQFIRTRWNISQKWSFKTLLANGSNQNRNEFFNNQNYSINYKKIEPQLVIQPNTSFRSILTFQYKNSINDSPSKEKAIKQDFSVELTYNQNTKTSIRTNASFIKIQYDGEDNTPVEFAILETLKKGRNYLWSLNLERQLSKSILMSVGYEGRKTGNNRTVHIGRAQVRANF